MMERCAVSAGESLVAGGTLPPISEAIMDFYVALCLYSS